MIRKTLLISSIAITIACMILWIATDRHYYTKYQVVETVSVEIAEDDPLAATGFYDDTESGAAGNTETVARDSFHFGLLPTPNGLFDKHAISVISILGPFWALTALAFVAPRFLRRHKPSAQTPEATHS